MIYLVCKIFLSYCCTLHFVANEALDRLSSVGLHANMILYLMFEYHFDSATGTSVLFLWSALSNFMPIFGAFLSDSFLGRFRVIAIGTVVSLLVSNILPEIEKSSKLFDNLASLKKLIIITFYLCNASWLQSLEYEIGKTLSLDFLCSCLTVFYSNKIQIPSVINFGLFLYLSNRTAKDNIVICLDFDLYIIFFYLHYSCNFLLRFLYQKMELKKLFESQN